MAKRPGANRRQLGGVTGDFTKSLPTVEDILKDTKNLNLQSSSSYSQEITEDEVTTINTEAIEASDTLNIENPIPNTIEQTTINNIEDDKNNNLSLVDHDANVSSTYGEFDNDVEKKIEQKDIRVEKESNNIQSLDEVSMDDPFEALSQKEIISSKEIVYLDVHSLVPADLETYYNHCRPYTDKELAKLIYSIIRDGIIYPLLVYKEKSGRLVVIAGNHRLIAVLTIIELYGNATWFDANTYKTIKCIVLEEEDENGNCVSLDEARRIVIETNIRRENTSEEEIAASLYYEREILRRETRDIYRFPILQTLAIKIGRTKPYVHLALQIYEKLIPDLKVLYYRKKAFNKKQAELLSILSPNVQQWLYDEYADSERLEKTYLSMIDKKIIAEKLIAKDDAGIKEYLAEVLNATVSNNEILVEIRKQIPQSAKQLADKTLDELAAAASNLTVGNTLMTMWYEIPKYLDSEVLKQKCLEAMIEVVEKEKLEEKDKEIS